MGDSFSQAAQVLGWTVSKIVATPTPAGIQAAFNGAIQQRRDADVSDGLVAAAYQHQIQQLHAMHAFVVSNNGTDYAGQNGIDLQTGAIPVNNAANQLLADKVLVDDGLKGDIGEVYLTGFPIIANYAGAFDREIKAKCSSCTITKVEVQPTDIGKSSAGEIANFLRVHPDIKQVYLTYDTVALGLQAAVKGAGVPFPELYSWAVDNSGLAPSRPVSARPLYRPAIRRPGGSGRTAWRDSLPARASSLTKGTSHSQSGPTATTTCLQI